MSLWYTTSTRTQETGKVEATLSAPVSLSLACTQAVQSAHTDSSALANSITERSVLLGPDLTELVSDGAGGGARTPPAVRLWPRLARRKKHTEVVGGRRRWLLQHPRHLHAVCMN